MKQTSETNFAPDWLALREPADHAARDPDLLAQAAACVKPGQTVLDLGCGTGSTARAFENLGFSAFNWHFFDNDPALLKIAQAKHPGARVTMGDVSQIAALPLDNVGLVTASALLDLMPLSWVSALVDRTSAAGVPVYAALNYDGEMYWTPSLAQDQAVTDAFNAHQRRDKGLGPALGPTSGAVFAQLAETKGCDVVMTQSPWRIGQDDAALFGQLVTGIAQAANEIEPDCATAWLRDMQSDVRKTTGVIGHTDVLAIPR